jgi:hypothetical protein
MVGSWQGSTREWGRDLRLQGPRHMSWDGSSGGTNPWKEIGGERLAVAVQFDNEGDIVETSSAAEWLEAPYGRVS